MDKAVVAQKSPFAVEITAGVTYYWCRCGRSAKQPWCDGSHKDTSFTPVSFVADETETVYMCGCKSTGTQPFCDGTHSSL